MVILTDINSISLHIYQYPNAKGLDNGPSTAIEARTKNTLQGRSIRDLFTRTSMILDGNSLLLSGCPNLWPVWYTQFISLSGGRHLNIALNIASFLAIPPKASGAEHMNTPTDNLSLEEVILV